MKFANYSSVTNERRVEMFISVTNKRSPYTFLESPSNTDSNGI